MRRNIEAYNKYKLKMQLLGKSDFEYEIDEVNDRVSIVRYIDGSSDGEVTIQGFVTDIQRGAFVGVTKSLKVKMDNIQIRSLASVFANYWGTKLDLSEFNTSHVHGMHNMFQDCSKLTELDLSGFDTSNVGSMEFMFCGCRMLEKLDVSSFDTSHVSGIQYMFSNCKNLEELDVSNFDTGEVKTMGFMFSGCTNLRKVDLSHFNTSKTRSLRYMFYWCEKLEELSLNGCSKTSIGDIKCALEERVNNVRLYY